MVRRVLAAHYRPERRDNGPSWLTLLGHTKDSLWSLDLFRTESILLRSHWVLVVMDQFTRRIVGFGVQAILDHLFYWNAGDLERKLELFRSYFNATRAHQGLGGDTPEEKAGGSAAPMATLTHYRWQSHCHGLVYCQLLPDQQFAPYS